MTPFVRWLYAEYNYELPDDFPHCVPDLVNIPKEFWNVDY